MWFVMDAYHSVLWMIHNLFNNFSVVENLDDFYFSIIIDADVFVLLVIIIILASWRT